MTDLLPCPFCGGEAKICSGENIYIATCKDLECGCRHDWSASKEDAISRWNTRNQWQDISTRPKNEECLVFGGTWNGEINVSEPSGIAHVEGKLMVVGTDAYSAWITDPTHWQPLPEPPEDG